MRWPRRCCCNTTSTARRVRRCEKTCVVRGTRCVGCCSRLPRTTHHVPRTLVGVRDLLLQTGSGQISVGFRAGHGHHPAPRDLFKVAMRDTSLERELGIKPSPAGVDGYMYPTTYVVPMRMRARDLVKVMTHEFISRWQPEWDARLGELHMTRHEIVTLASIIEAEVRYRPDRPYVSAVYHNRLKRGMALQADPTIIYAYGRRLRRVWERQLQIRSPYNTYLYPGLPPGPITQPSDSSIIAALYPAPIGYLYFVAQPDGKHIFSASYADHLAAIRRVRQRR